MARSSKLPSFRKPPLIEVAYSLTFKNLQGFRAPHIGLYWTYVREEFPLVQHAPPLGPIPVEIDINDLPLPRVWFIREDRTRLIQVQSNRFVYNWRKVNPDDVYPRFEAIHDEFGKHLSTFETFVEEADIGKLEMTAYELTYINHIPKSDQLDNLRNISSLLPDVRWRDSKPRFLPDPQKLAWTAAFNLPDNRGALVADLKLATRKADMKEIFILELKATGDASTKGNESVSNWFSLAREWIVRGFADLTSEKYQVKMWERDSNAGS